MMEDGHILWESNSLTTVFKPNLLTISQFEVLSFDNTSLVEDFGQKSEACRGNR